MVTITNLGTKRIAILTPEQLMERREYDRNWKRNRRKVEKFRKREREIDHAYRARNLEHRQRLDRELYKKRYMQNPGHYISKSLLRRCNKKLAQPKWANLDNIKQIYLHCPPGYEVDHIIPLRGKYVSGLHVEGNLQYLPKTENASKGNKWAA